MPPRRPRHLDSEASRAEFERRYGKEHGDLVWRETLGKVAREQASHNPSGVKVEHVPGHVSFSSRGKREIVKPHEARVHAHPHSRGDHPGACSRNCRAGRVGHSHPGRGRRRRR
jgi:hypothetical protein